MQFEEVKDFKCPFCKNRKIKSFFPVKKDYGIVLCFTCSTALRVPFPKEEELNETHSSESYFTHQYFEKRRNLSSAKYLYKRMSDLLSSFYSKDKKELAILDIGCDTGAFLESITDTKISKLGVEVSPQAVKCARSKGLDVICGNFLHIEFSSKFDFIVANDIWEHMLYPYKFLEKVKTLLKKDGVAYFTFPSPISFIYRLGFFFARLNIMQKAVERLYPRYHVFYPHPKKVKKVLEELNFKIILFQGKKFNWEELAIDNILLKIGVYFLNKLENLFNSFTIWEVIVKDEISN